MKLKFINFLTCVLDPKKTQKAGRERKERVSYLALEEERLRVEETDELLSEHPGQRPTEKPLHPIG